MYKNIIISAMGAVLAARSMPGLADCGPLALVAAFMGIFMPLLALCSFCDGLAERWRSRERGRRQLAEYIRRLGKEQRWDG
ncbi:MAG: hypothetical protein NC331_11470 [Lachnospiraceae bacterium]|nr:hypothetical protein [Lachnospiraceae bacterium]MCM1239987.1 hypothetical protein [Lachnospiraceae bacterium]